MRLVTFSDEPDRGQAGDERPDHGQVRPARFGVLHGTSVVDPDLALRADLTLRRGHGSTEPMAPREMVAFFESGAHGRAQAERALQIADEYAERGDELTAPDGTRAVLPQADVRLLAPVPRPRRIRDYLTYTEHAAGSGLQVRQRDPA